MMQDMAQPKRHVIASTDGVELAVHDHGGAGPTLVFCHATGLHGRVWDPVADALGGDVRRLAVDLRGHGRSEMPTSGYTVDDNVDDLEALLDGWGIDGPVHVGGSSMGGLLATEVLIDHPQLFDRYVIVSPSLWWGGEALLDRAAEGLRQNGLGAAQVFVTLGSEPDEMHAVADRLVAVLREAAPQVRVGYEPMPDETHATILHRGFYRAIEWFYGDEFPGM